MGALRAAELHTFGMRGIGSIYEAYRSGELQDDDEVAVAHGDAASGFRASSEAMVNIRATLARAEKTGAIRGELRNYLERVAKECFYPDRTYPGLLARARIERGCTPELAMLENFIQEHRVDAKREDARAMLARMRLCTETLERAAPCSFELANSEPWAQLRAWARAAPRLGSDLPPAQLVAAEARASGAKGRAVLAGAIGRRRLAEMARLARTAAAPADGSPARPQHDSPESIEHHVVAESREAGLYDELARRAADKERTLARHGLAHATYAGAHLPSAYVVAWYLGRLGHAGTPTGEVSPNALHAIGLGDSAELEREALREYLYVSLVPHAAEDALE